MILNIIVLFFPLTLIYQICEGVILTYFEGYFLCIKK